MPRYNRSKRYGSNKAFSIALTYYIFDSLPEQWLLFNTPTHFSRTDIRIAHTMMWLVNNKSIRNDNLDIC